MEKNKIISFCILLMLSLIVFNTSSITSAPGYYYDGKWCGSVFECNKYTGFRLAKYEKYNLNGSGKCKYYKRIWYKFWVK